MSDPRLVLRFSDHESLIAEYELNFAHGRAFVPDATGLALFSPCELVIEHPCRAEPLRVACEVVRVDELGGGVGLQFRDRSEAVMAELGNFVDGTEQDLGADDDDAQDAPESGDPADADQHAQARAQQRALVEARANKLRNLNPAERIQVARSSVLEERVLLERIYGSAVWELLLRNPKITPPEVARMARKGTMPRPLLDIIAENEQWIRHSLVRRALLANPRLGPDAITRVLRSLPPRELKLVPQQTAYPQNVRQTAMRLMRG